MSFLEHLLVAGQFWPDQKPHLRGLWTSFYRGPSLIGALLLPKKWILIFFSIFELKSFFETPSRPFQIAKVEYLNSLWRSPDQIAPKSQVSRKSVYRFKRDEVTDRQTNRQTCSFIYIDSTVTSKKLDDTIERKIYR